MKLLLVGHETESLAGVERLFLEMGHDITTLGDLQQAFDYLQRDDRVAGLYIDWTVPEKDGLTLCQKARNLQRRPYFPIIIMLAPEGRDIIPRALKAGIDNFLIKPLDKTFLAAQLQIIGRAQKLEDELLELNATLEGKVKNRTRELAIAYEKLQKTNRDLVSAYENLCNTNREIAEMDRMKTAFIGVTAHELRTPLTTIMGVLHLLASKRADDSAEDTELLEIGLREARRLADKIDKAIQFAYQSHYERPLEKESIDVGELIVDVMQAVTFFANRRQQQIQSILAEDLPPILVDRDKIFDVLINLLMNAIKFTPDGERILLTVRRRDAGVIEFSVEDRGIGISEEDQPYIFKRFYTSLRIDHHSSGEYEFCGRGLGLGLAVAREFVEMHGGEIGIKFTSAKGSCICFTIPISNAGNLD